MSHSNSVLTRGPPTKRKKNETSEASSSICFLCRDICEERHEYTETQWDAFKLTAKNWDGLDKYGQVYLQTDWVKGTKDEQMVFHRSCTKYMQTQSKLNQAIKRRDKRIASAADNNSNNPSSSSISITNIQDSVITQLSPPPTTSSSDNTVKSSFRKSTRASVGVIFDKNLCIWCREPDESISKKKGKTDNSWYRVEQKKSWRHICACTPFLQDSVMRERLLAIIAMFPKDDCFFADIHYHKKCWDRYVSHSGRNRKTHRQHVGEVSTSEVNAVFIDHVERIVCQLKEPRTLKGLLDDYHNILFDLRGEEKQYKTSYIRNIISEEFGDQIAFHDRLQRNASTFVFDSSEGGSFLESAVNSWGLPIEELLHNVARRVNESAKNIPHMPWPPSLDSVTTEAPENFLTQFVGWLVSPEKKEAILTPEVYAIASLLQSLVTGKRTAFQVLWSNLIYGLSRSKELVELSKKFGFGVSYQDVRNLLASWAKQDIESEICPQEITNEYPAVVIMDNDDFKTDTLTGASETNHRTNVMFVQNENLLDKSLQSSKVPKLIMPKGLSSTVENLNKVHPYKTTKSGDPSVRKEFPIRPSNTNEIRAEQFIHSMVRINEDGENITPDDQGIGSFGGFQALLEGEVSKSKPYYWLTFPKPPHKSVVNEVMTRLLTIIEKKGLPFVLLTGDQPVYTLIVQLVNEGSGKFDKIIPILGPFHTQVAFITAISKRFEGSGLSDIFVSAGIIADKSVDQAMRGKHFRRIVRALQLTYEAFQRKIIQKGIDNGLKCPDHVKAQITKLRNQQYHDLNMLRECIKHDPEFRQFQESCYDRIEKTPMTEYWLSFMTMVETLIMNIHAVKVKDWSLFKDSLRLMIPWLQIYDKLHYGKWLTNFWSDMVNLNEDVSKLMPAIFSHSITGKPYSSLPTDLWIEMTMNKGSKMKAGWQRILGNEQMLCANIRSTNYINQMRVTVHRIANIKLYKSGHKENTSTRLKLDELAVQDVHECIVDFDCDPFDPDNDAIRSLQSGEIASMELQNDLLSAFEDGEEKLETFFKERVFSRIKEWGIQKSNRKTFFSTKSEKKISASINKTVKMENEAMSKVISDYCDSKVTLTEILQHRVTDECLSLFNTNGTMVKTQKSKLLQSFSFSPISPNEMRNYTAIIDMGFFWRYCIPTAEDREKGDETKYTWYDYALKIFTCILRRHQTASTIVFVNDPYDVKESIKAEEHANRSFIHGTKNVYIDPAGELPTKSNMSRFFGNKSNKIRLQQYLKGMFHNFSSSHPEKEFIYSVQRNCEDLRSKTNFASFTCNHQEADTIIFYIVHALRGSGNVNAIIIDAEDTDVLVLSSFVSHREEGILGLKRKKSVFDSRKLCSIELSSIIVKLHVLTGSDSTSGFFGRGKKAIINKVMKNIEQVKSMLQDLGESLSINDLIYEKVILFILRYVYNDKKSATLAESRCTIWRKMKKKSTRRLPPDEDTMRLHILRCNYVIFMNLDYMNQNAPGSPISHGWIMRDEVCLPIRYQNPALPPSMVVLPAMQADYNALDDENDESPRDDIIRETDTEEDSDSDGDLSTDDS